MKKLLTIAALAALTTTSCSYDQEVDVKKDSIGFGTYVGKVNTKAVEETTSAIQTGDHIGIFAYNHPNVLSGDFDANFMSNEELSYDKGWTYPNTKYWPNNNSKISFVAYHPYTNVTPSTDVTAMPTVANGTVAIPFTVNLVSPSAQKDLLWATNPNMTKPANGEKVNFAFTHALSKIQFKVQLAQEYPKATIRIKEVKLEGLTKTDTYKIPNTLGEGSWTLTSAKKEDICVAYGPMDSGVGQVVTKDIASLTTSTADESFKTTGLLLIPQTHIADTKLKIDYEVIYANPTYTVNESKTFVLAGKTVDGKADLAWEQNKIYTYTFKVALDAITFDVEVNNWADENKENNTDVPNVPIN